jgi:hypothetical protein
VIRSRTIRDFVAIASPLRRSLAMALRVVAASVSVLLFGGPLGVGADDIAQLAALETELAQLLASARNGH